MISRSASPVASAISSISCAHSRDSATRPWVMTLANSPEKMGARASWRSSDFAKARAGCRLVLTSGVAQPLSASHAVPSKLRSPSSMVSRSDDRGRVETNSSPRLRWAMASVSAMRFSASSPATLPERNGGFSKARGGEVMRQHLRFGALDVREARLDHAGDLAVQLLPAALEQRVIRRILTSACLKV